MNMTILATIAAAGLAGMYVVGTPEEQDLYNAGLITVNPEDELNGQVKATITDAGTAALAELNKAPAVGFSGGAFASGNAFGAAPSGAVTSAPTTAPATASAPIRGALAISSVAKPKVTRKGSTSAYDFASLRAPAEMNGSYDAFFIVDGAKPAVKVAKNAISNAKVDFRREVGTKPSTLRAGKMEKIYEYDREFTVYTNPGPNGEVGAWVARTK